MVFENQIVEELWNSKCLKDYKNNHRMEKLGISDRQNPELIWRCTQCKKCLIEPLIFLEVDDDAFHISEEDEKARKIIEYFFKQIKDHTKISRRKFYSVLHQVYYLAQEVCRKNKDVVKK